MPYLRQTGNSNTRMSIPDIPSIIHRKGEKTDEYQRNQSGR